MNWNITVKTDSCDAVDDYMTRIVNRDWTSTFTGHRKLLKHVKYLDKEKMRMLKREVKRMGGNLRYREPLGYKAADYRDRLVYRDNTMSA